MTTYDTETNFVYAWCECDGCITLLHDVMSVKLTCLTAATITSTLWLAVGYTMDTLYFSWLETPVDVDVDLQLPHFTLKEAILYDCSQNYTAGQCLLKMLCMCLLSCQTSHARPVGLQVDTKIGLLAQHEEKCMFVIKSTEPRTHAPAYIPCPGPTDAFIAYTTGALRKMWAGTLSLLCHVQPVTADY